MDERVEAKILVRPVLAALLQDPRNQRSLGEALGQSLWPDRYPNALADAIAALKVDVRAAGLTDHEIDQELRDHKAERRAVRAAE